MELYFGIDIGGTKIAMGIVNKKGNILDSLIMQTNIQISYEESLNKIIKAYKRIIRKIPKNSEIKSIGISCPGPLDSHKGIIINPANLLSWHNKNIVEDIYRSTNIPTYLKNDTNAAALAENWVGSAKNYMNIIYVTFSTGISAGIINGGELFEGYFGVAGELGHMIVEPNGPKCHCGSYGCLEELACGRTFLKRAKNIKQNYETYGFSYLFARYVKIINCIIHSFEDSSNKKISVTEYCKNLELSIEKGKFGILVGSKDNISAKEIGELAKDDDIFAQFIYCESAFFLGIAIVNLITLFDPQIIILGGGLTKSWNIFFPVLNASIKYFLKQVPFDRYRIKRTKLGDMVGIIGAVRNAMLNETKEGYFGR